MSWFGKKKPASANPPTAPAARPAFEAADTDVDDDPAELHFCCMCGERILGLDLEDELDGEGPGNDICGACNRTKNFEVELGY